METMGLTGTYTTRNHVFFRFTIKYGYSKFNAMNQRTVSREKKRPQMGSVSISGPAKFVQKQKLMNHWIWK